MLADPDIDYGVQRAIVVTRFAVLECQADTGPCDALCLRPQTVKVVLVSRQAPRNEQGITLSRDCNLRV